MTAAKATKATPIKAATPGKAATPRKAAPRETAATRKATEARRAEVRKAMEMIGAERLRQISEERFTHAHDDAHREGELASAADCYAFLTGAMKAPANFEGLYWPFHPSMFKPHPDPRRNLVKAGALYLAEGERYRRAGKLDQAERCDNSARLLANAIAGTL